MRRSFGVQSLTRVCVLLSLAVPAVLCASFQGASSSRGIVSLLSRRDAIGVAVGVDHSEDGAYSVNATVGESSISLAIATDLGDFVAVSTGCQTVSCKHFNGTLYDDVASFSPFSNTTVPLFYDNAAASGLIGEDSVIIGGLNVPDQTLAAISSFNRSNLFNGTAGVLGLGFPVTSVAVAQVNGGTPSSNNASDFLSLLYAHGPIVTTFSTYGDIDEPLFSLTFNPNISGDSESGQFTIGSLPTGVDNSSLTWATVRLYDIGLNGTVPIHWEVEVDAIFLDGNPLPGSSQIPKVTAVVDTTTATTGGPKDAIDTILAAISSTTPACNGSHTLSFQIGGKLFPVAPQDLVTKTTRGCAVNVEAIDSPRSNLTLYSWRLGAAFLRSNLVAFHYGDPTNPSVEPPRMGFMVSSDARSSRGGVGVARCAWIVLVLVGLVTIL
ncbi:hypothetical protein V8D89_002669 [Ganoderma adspersum]